jgi:hypothetical protein
LAAAAIAWAAHSVWVCVLALALLFGTGFPLLWRLVSFAERHPQAALFEGAEFLAHEQMQMGMKATPILPESGSTTQPPVKPAIKADAAKGALPDNSSDV